MHGAPPRLLRRKHVVPMRNAPDSDFWDKAFEVHALEPMDRARSRAGISGKLTAGQKSTHTHEDTLYITGTKNFLDLPGEIQTRVIQFASTPDLIALSLVSKHFHHLAASRLYREFRIVFPDVDYLTSDKPIDALACGLDTFTTSDYNYAQHLRSITLESTESGEKAERAYKLYSMEKSCGKFMNTLFMLTLKKARKLDTFRWDIRVEISRPTFQALHNLPTLQHLHLRLQPGRSTYEIPPSLQKPSISHGTKDTFLSEPSAFDLGTTSIGTGHDPPTLSGFKNLQSLSILDMDNRDYIPETRACIRNSAHTLRRLHLSFSEKLAQSSRAPIARTPVEVIELDAQMAASDDDYMTDDWGHVPGPPPPPITSSEDESHGGLSKALKAKEERAQQESVLARILGVPSAVTGEVVAAAKVNGVKDTLLKPTDMVDIEPLVQCHKKLASIIKLFVKTSYKGQGHEQTQKDILNLVEKTSTEILELQKKSAKTLTTEAVDTNTTTAAALGAEASTSEADIASETAVGDVLPAITTALNGQKTEVPTEVSTMFEQIPKKKKVKISDFTPEDIDLDAPEIEVGSGVFEDIEAGEAQQDAASEIDSARNTGYGGDKLKALSRAAQARHGHLKVMQRKHEALHRRLRESDTHAGLLSKRIQEMGRVPGGTKPSVLREMRRELENLQVSMVDIGEQLNQMSFDVDQQLLFTEALSDSNAYTNTTRGLQLTELALYLIPLRPSVLENAIDMHALQSITLLNVGPQDKFWSSLSVLNKEEPLKLKSVFSDNASLPLLQLLGSLHDLEDLFLMEGRKKPLPRDGRRPPTQPTRATQLAPRTIVKLDAIRKKVLRRHMGSLKRLVINNWDDKSWDADEVFIKMVCRKGKQLEELGLSMDPRATHTFNQYLPCLTELRAIHILHFRNDDKCPWVAREVRKFAVDCVAAHPKLKLEYIALEDEVERLGRRLRQTKVKPAKKDIKGKGKALEKDLENTKSMIDSLQSLYHSLGGPPPDVSSEESEGSDADWDGDRGHGLRVETLETFSFFDVSGVRMWEKDVLGGWL